MVAVFNLPAGLGNLGPTGDPNCHIPTRVDYVYKSTSNTGNNLTQWPAGATEYPANLVFTTTTEGKSVPYILRLETGTVNRAIYQTMILHDNIPSKPGPGLFDKIFLHSQLPTGSIKQGQTWKDPVDNALMPTGLMEASTIDYKVPTVNATSIVVKAGFQVPIVKPPTVTDQKVTGSYAIAREYNFHRGGYLQSSKEDVTFAKKVDASGADAAFYKEDSSAYTKQQLTIKKKPAEKK